MTVIPYSQVFICSMDQFVTHLVIRSRATFCTAHSLQVLKYKVMKLWNTKLLGTFRNHSKDESRNQCLWGVISLWGHTTCKKTTEEIVLSNWNLFSGLLFCLERNTWSIIYQLLDKAQVRTALNRACSQYHGVQIFHSAVNVLHYDSSNTEVI